MLSSLTGTVKLESELRSLDFAVSVDVCELSNVGVHVAMPMQCIYAGGQTGVFSCILRCWCKEFKVSNRREVAFCGHYYSNIRVCTFSALLHLLTYVVTSRHTLPLRMWM